MVCIIYDIKELTELSHIVQQEQLLYLAQKMDAAILSLTTENNKRHVKSYRTFIY